MSNRVTRARLVALAAVPVAFVVATYFWPLTAVVTRSFRGSSRTTVTEVIGAASTWRLLGVTALQAAVSTAIAVLIGVPAAWCHARLHYRGRQLVWSAAGIGFVLPAVVVAVGLRSLVGADRVGSWTWVIVAHVAVNVAVIMRTTGTRFVLVGADLEEAARALGRSKLGAVIDVTIRGSLDAIVGASLVVFLFCLTSFGIVLTIGGGALRTVEIEIWLQTTRLYRLDVAAVLVGLQFVLVIGALIAHGLVTRSRPPIVSTEVSRRRLAGWPERLSVTAVSATVLALSVAPVAALAVRSVRVDGRWSLLNYSALSRPLVGSGGDITIAGALWSSMLVALTATAICLAVAVPAAVVIAPGGRAAHLLDAALLVPLATSAVTVGFGFLLGYSSPALDLRGAWIAIPLVESAIAAPLVVRVLVPSFRSIDPALADAARSLGATRWRRFATVVLPTIRSAIAVGLALSFAVSVGEFGATTVLARTTAPTLPQVISRLLGRPGSSNLGRALAVSTILALLCAVVFGAAERFGGRRTRALEF